MNFLFNFDFDIKYIFDIINKVIDILSYYSYTQVNVIIMSIIDLKIRDEIRKSYHENNFFKSIVANLEQNSFYIIQDNDLIYLHNDCFCISNSKFTRELLLHQHHDNENHFDMRKSYQALSSRYFWLDLSKNVRKYTASCSQCFRNKFNNRVPADLLYPLSVSHERFSNIAMNFVDLFPKSNEYDMILIIIDRLMNYVHIKLTHSMVIVLDIIYLIYNIWCRQFGLPQRIISDHDKLFMSQFWKTLHKFLEIEI